MAGGSRGLLCADDASMSGVERRARCGEFENRRAAGCLCSDQLGAWRTHRKQLPVGRRSGRLSPVRPRFDQRHSTVAIYLAECDSNYHCEATE